MAKSGFNRGELRGEGPGLTPDELVERAKTGIPFPPRRYVPGQGAAFLAKVATEGYASDGIKSPPLEHYPKWGIRMWSVVANTPKEGEQQW